MARYRTYCVQFAHREHCDGFEVMEFEALRLLNGIAAERAVMDL
jgi:hypothetical protein